MARLHLGRSSFEAQLAMLRIASFTPQDDGVTDVSGALLTSTHASAS
jgi:hypothetical protein